MIVINSRQELDNRIHEAICMHLGIKKLYEIPDNQIRVFYFDIGINSYRFLLSKHEGDDWILQYRWYPPKSSKSNTVMEEIVYESTQGARSRIYFSYYLFSSEYEHNWLGKLFNDEVHLVFSV